MQAWLAAMSRSSGRDVEIAANILVFMQELNPECFPLPDIPASEDSFVNAEIPVFEASCERLSPDLQMNGSGVA